MNIDKAFSHIEWRFKNNISATAKDKASFEALKQWRETQEQKSLYENESLAKLWIEKMILLSRTNLYSGKRSIEIIHEILNRSVYDWCVVMQNEVPMMRFNSILIESGMNIPNENEKPLKHPLNDKEQTDKIVFDNADKLTDALNSEITIEEITALVASEINFIINTFDK